MSTLPLATAYVFHIREQKAWTHGVVSRWGSHTFLGREVVGIARLPTSVFKETSPLFGMCAVRHNTQKGSCSQYMTVSQQISNRSHFQSLSVVFISIYKRYKIFSYADSKQLFINVQILKN
jgi:hypothetical protein